MQDPSLAPGTADDTENLTLRHYGKETQTDDRRGLKATVTEVGIAAANGLIETR
jgi:hypothetical protein